jgi:DNA mismatch endonuclease, patch repair protein
MPDKFTPEVRSRIMASIRSKNTKLELRVFRALRLKKVYFQKHHKGTLGSPDICLPKRKIAVFIDGDFWHGYRYKKWRDRLGSDFWRIKIEKNMSRDRRNFRKLKRSGWKIMRIWEHDLNKKEEKTITRIFEFLRNDIINGKEKTKPKQNGIVLRKARGNRIQQASPADGAEDRRAIGRKGVRAGA